MLLLNKTLLQLAKGLWGWILSITALKLVVLVGTALFAQSIGGFLGTLDSPSLTGEAMGAAIRSALLAALLMLAAELLIGELEYRCTAQARLSLRRKIFAQALALGVGHIERVGPVSAITAAVDGVESMQVYYSKYLPGLLYCLIAPFYLFWQMRQYSLPVAGFLLAVSLVLMPVNNLFRKHIEALKTEYWDSLEDLTGYYLESVRGLTTLKLYNQDQRRTDGLRDKADRFNRKIMDVMKINFRSFLLTDGLIFGAVAVSVALAGHQLAQGNISFSAALTVLLLAFGFFASVRQLMSVTHTALLSVAAADKVSRLLEMDTSRPYDPHLPPEDNPFPGLRMEGITFAYPGRAPALRNLTLEIPRGKTTALVGLSGCGKSTVASLLMGFFDPAAGRILLEGRDTRSFTPAQLREKRILVPQTVSLFSGTIRDNLLLAAPQATDQELLEALEEVWLKDWVLAQPLGLDTDVGDAGQKLSGGQRQKIGIARALLCQAEYILFDEATSSVDLDSEREIWRCIDALAKTRTLLIISHRLSTIQGADQIYVLDRGQVAQRGTHRQLMAEGGLYRRLVEEQQMLEHQGEEGLRHD